MPKFHTTRRTRRDASTRVFFAIITKDYIKTLLRVVSHFQCDRLRGGGFNAAGFAAPITCSSIAEMRLRLRGASAKVVPL